MARYYNSATCKEASAFFPAVVDAFLRLLHQHDEDYQEGQTTDFLLEFQKLKFLREPGTER